MVFVLRQRCNLDQTALLKLERSPKVFCLCQMLVQDGGIEVLIVKVCLRAKHWARPSMSGLNMQCITGRYVFQR